MCASVSRVSFISYCSDDVSVSAMPTTTTHFSLGLPIVVHSISPAPLRDGVRVCSKPSFEIYAMPEQICHSVVSVKTTLTYDVKKKLT